MTKDKLVFTDRHIWCDLAVSLIEAHFPDEIEIVRGGKGDKMPEGYGKADYDLVISFLSPFIIPSEVLRSSKLSVNFHPGTRDYPGIGCFNFALYEMAEVYGAVCHHMKEKVDTGLIIEERTFRVYEWDTVESLQFRAYISLVALLESFLQSYNDGSSFDEADIEWSRKPFTRKQLNELARLTDDLDEVEFRRRLRATDYPSHPPRIDLNGRSIVLDDEPSVPLAFSFFSGSKE